MQGTVCQADTAAPCMKGSLILILGNTRALIGHVCQYEACMARASGIKGVPCYLPQFAAPLLARIADVPTLGTGYA